jgi:hypothetical protein
MNKEEIKEVEKRNRIITEQEKADVILNRQSNMSSDDKNEIRDIISKLSNDLIHKK